jgi:hypothetical protein
MVSKKNGSESDGKKAKGQRTKAKKERREYLDAGLEGRLHLAAGVGVPVDVGEEGVLLDARHARRAGAQPVLRSPREQGLHQALRLQRHILRTLHRALSNVRAFR